MKLLWVLVFGVLAASCIEQHDPRRDWQKFRQERDLGNKKVAILSEKGELPPEDDGGGVQLADLDADTAYANYCANCHGATGAGDGVGGAAMTPKPRDFVNWDYSEISGDVDEYLVKIIRDGGVAVGKSALMAPWGGVVSENTINELVKKVKSFRK